MAELRRRLEELAGRGRPRGAVRVWSDATAGGATAAGGAWRRQPAVAFLAALVGVALLGSALVDLGDGGDGGGATDPTLIASSRLAGFESCDALLDHLKAAAAERVGPYGLGGGVIAFEDFAGAGGDRRELAGSASDDDAAPPDGSSQTGDSSTTNVQEAGVDEPDVVKTDGSIVYALARGRLWAVEQRGAPTILGSVAVTSGESMLLVGDRLLVVGSGGREVQPLAARRSAGMIVEDGGGFLPAVTVTVVDVSEPAAMAVTDSFDVDGGYVSARLVDGIARIVVRSHGPQLDFVYPSTGSASAMARATEVNRGVVEASTLADWLPTYRHDGDDDREPAYDCDRVYAPTEFSGFGMLTVLTVDPTDPRPDGTTTVVADGETVYASTGRLYVATNRWETVPAGGGEPGSGTATIEPGSPVTRPAPDVHTLVHSFDIRGDEPARYLVSGRVRGTLLNQFSMSEHEGDLRVATTDRSDDGSTSESFVTVLTDDGETLRQVGQVGGLGRDEQIYAVRFLGDKGYVVTFRRTDPLYVLDLSDPASPRVTGELKIPGYSAYLHPLEGDLLIG
ncbi:MAG: beta-propeller domain-containing protein, partial [Acidimicrobiia bacterium]